MKHFNQLTPAEAERIALLMEECGEVVQICGKILRHGYESCHPKVGSLRNRSMLEKEIGDIKAALTLMLDASDVSENRIGQARTEKLCKVGQYLHHNKHLLQENSNG